MLRTESLQCTVCALSASDLVESYFSNHPVCLLLSRHNAHAFFWTRGCHLLSLITFCAVADLRVEATEQFTTYKRCNLQFDEKADAWLDEGGSVWLSGLQLVTNVRSRSC